MANPAAQAASPAVPTEAMPAEHDMATMDQSAHTEAAEGDHAVAPTLLGLEPFQWVSISMAVLLLIAFGAAKVHKVIAGGLDSKIAEIMRQLDEAKQLRADAEALKAEYVAKIANAEKDAVAMLDHAKAEAEAIVDRAETDTKAMIERRKQMAEDKIAAAERGVVDELRAKAADAATRAAGSLIAARHDAQADSKLVDQAISGL